MFIKMVKGFTILNGKTYSEKDGAFEVDDSTGKRFVALGVAETEKETSSVQKEETPNVQDAEVPENEEVESFEEMSISELREMAKELGLDIKSNKKIDYINAIEEAQKQEMPVFNPEGALS